MTHAMTQRPHRQRCGFYDFDPLLSFTDTDAQYSMPLQYHLLARSPRTKLTVILFNHVQ